VAVELREGMMPGTPWTRDVLVVLDLDSGEIQTDWLTDRAASEGLAARLRGLLGEARPVMVYVDSSSIFHAVAGRLLLDDIHVRTWSGNQRAGLETAVEAWHRQTCRDAENKKTLNSLNQRTVLDEAGSL